MPLVDMKDLLQHASREGYAGCAFDLAGLDFLAVAEGCRAPVVLSVADCAASQCRPWRAVEHRLHDNVAALSVAARSEP